MKLHNSKEKVIKYNKMPSLTYFTIVNTAIWSIGLFTYNVYIQFPYILPLWIFIVDLGFVYTLQTQHNLQQVRDIRKIIPISCLNAASLFINARFFSIPTFNLLYEILLFIPYGFIFELIFDFFHYWTHRMSHKSLFLYRNVHNRHHRQVQVSIYTTFEHNTMDILFTNMVPIALTSYLLQPTDLFLCIWIFYKVLEEMYGHIGINTRASSFPQCVWLPRIFGIELYSTDHAYHHKNPNVNFSKRFKLWDKLFGTYQSPND